MNQTLHIQNALQSRQILGIQVLASPIGTGMSPEGTILRFIVIGMDIPLRTNGGERMFDLNPLNPLTTLRPFDFHRHL